MNEQDIAATAAPEALPAWLCTSSCRASYLGGRADTERTARAHPLPDEIVEDVVRILRSVTPLRPRST